MKVQLQGRSFYPSLGGVETYLYHAAKTLLKLGHEPSIFCSRHLPYLGKEEVCEGIKIIRHPPYILRFPASLINPFYRVARLRRFVNKKAFDVDIVLSRSYDYCLASYNTLKAQLVYIPPTIKPLELKILMSKRGIMKRLLTRFINFEVKFMEKKGMYVCDKIVVFSKLMKNLIIRKYYISNKKIKVIPPGVEINKFKPKQKDQTLIRELGISTDSKVILTVCRLTPQKNIDMLIKSFTNIREKNTYLIIVGDGPEKSSLEKMARNLRLTNRVKFVGFKRDVERFYSTADVFVLPSIYEPFGHVFLEAMSSGVPCIGLKGKHYSILTACDEIIENGKTGYYVKSEIDDLKTKMDEIIQNDELREKMGRRARELCEKKYSWEKHITNLLSII